MLCKSWPSAGSTCATCQQSCHPDWPGRCLSTTQNSLLSSRLARALSVNNTKQSLVIQTGQGAVCQQHKTVSCHPDWPGRCLSTTQNSLLSSRLARALSVNNTKQSLVIQTVQGAVCQQHKTVSSLSVLPQQTKGVGVGGGGVSSTNGHNNNLVIQTVQGAVCQQHKTVSSLSVLPQQTKGVGVGGGGVQMNQQS